MTIIAEIGTSHGGDLEKAFRLIDAAKNAGADCVKFQWIHADEILHPDTGFVNLPTGRIKLYDNFKKLELPSDFYKSCMDYARKNGLLFACSPFGTKSFDELVELEPDAVKIASPELNHYPLLERCAEIYGKIPVIISSGVSKIGDIEKAIEIIESKNCGEKSGCGMKLPPLTLLHCITFYPAPEDEYNIRCVENLSRVFGVPAGISDHSMDPVLVPTLTAAVGGTMIEKHITLSRKTDGLDDPVALEPEQFLLMCHSVRQSLAIIERNTKNLPENEVEGAMILSRKEIMRQLEYEYGMEKIRTVLGTGIKRLAPAEHQNYGRTNRSLHFMRAMKAGERIGMDDIAVLRTEKILLPGIGPEFLDVVIGKKLVRDVSDGKGLEWSDLLS